MVTPSRPSHWDTRGIVAALLWPLEALFRASVRVRRYAYARGWRKRVTLGVPVLVVGNITVGGVGKTPLVLWLAEHLRREGLRPGIVSRGYRARPGTTPLQVTGQSRPEQVGDEPLMLARRSGCPVVVHPDRVAAAALLLARNPVDVVISDDGLQHYRLRRDVEIVVVDGDRRFGNGRLLPAGPLREPLTRLSEADFVVCNGNAPLPGEFGMRLRGDTAVSVATPVRTRALIQFRSGRVHAVAGIGNPRRFFEHLRAAGLDPVEHPFPDHHPFQAGELNFADGLPVIMTEKDAVKCGDVCGPDAWYVPVTAELDPEFAIALIGSVRSHVPV